MSCDIHLYIERRLEGRWINADIWRVSPFWEPEDPGSEEFYRESAFLGQSYDLFAILADVRNYGDEPIEPISSPRGLPPDVSPTVARGCNHPDLHSHSWLTLAELRAYDWATPIPQQQRLDVQEFYELLVYGHPLTRGLASLPVDSVTISPEELEALLPAIFEDPNAPRYVTDARWTQPAHELVEDFLTSTLPRLEAVRRGDDIQWYTANPEVTDEEVRIVFCFDG